MSLYNNTSCYIMNGVEYVSICQHLKLNVCVLKDICDNCIQHICVFVWVLTIIVENVIALPKYIYVSNV